MSSPALSQDLNGLKCLSTANLVDAAVKLGLPARLAPPEIVPLEAFPPIAGRARPVRHFGSVDVFLEAIDRARPGDVLVIDNQGRKDEAAIGDLIVQEAKSAGLAGIVLWGLHRDSSEIFEINFPVWSLGAYPSGPTRLDGRSADALERAEIGPHLIGGDDIVIGDGDGVLFLERRNLDRIAEAARLIRETELKQIRRIKQGETLRAQLKFSDYLERNAEKPAVSFRQHLREISGAIET